MIRTSLRLLKSAAGIIVPDFVRLLESSEISLTYPIRSPVRYLSLILDVTMLVPSVTALSPSRSPLKSILPFSMPRRLPVTTQGSDVLAAMAEILLSSSMMDRTWAQPFPTSVTMPIRPPWPMTFILTAMPSFVPLFTTNVLYQFPGSFEMTCAAILLYSLYFLSRL